MKRLMLLAVLCAFVLSAATASAVDVKVSGNILSNAVWKSNWDFNKQSTARNFDVYQRADLYFTAVANENLKGVLGFRSTKDTWGGPRLMNGNPGGSSSSYITVRDAYIDFNWPGTDTAVKAGVQSVTLPNEVGGSFLQDARSGAIFVTQPFNDNISAMAGWARLENQSQFGPQTQLQSELDAWVLALPMSFEGFSFTPFGAYAPIGTNYAAGGHLGLASLNPTGLNYKNAYWLGLTYSIDILDPFVVKGDFNYGNVSADNKQDERSGWLFDLALEYKGLDFMTPEVYFVYTTGEDDDNTNGSERIPTLAGDWAVGSFWFGGDSITGGSLDNEWNQNGFWTLGVSLNDIQSFADGLTHNVHVLYVKGTNDSKSAAGRTYGRYLTEKDNLWEVSATNAYKIYDELTMYVDLGYINLTTKQSVWGKKGSNAYKVSTGLVFKY